MIRFRLGLVAVLLAFAGMSQAQENDPAKLLGLTRDSGSLPLWAKPSLEAKQDLGKTARSTEPGVFLVGTPKDGFGTAWVISKKHRLLVTNAHVGDIRHIAGGKMFAIPSGTSQLYTVEKVWYHPGVRRYIKGTPLSARSMDPKDGPVDPRSPDLALLRLSPDGPDLTVEFPIATSDELATLFAQPTAILGFPGHDTKEWPQLGDKAAMTFHDGVVSRITDFAFNPGAPAAELQFVQYTMATWGGFSGSPVVLPNGHVAAVHNMARTEKGQNGATKDIPHGVRVDCVIEMLVHNDLDDKVPFKIDRAKVSVDRWTKPDKEGEKVRAAFAQADELVREARVLIFQKQDFEKGEEKCNEALKLVPNYAPAYFARSYAFNNFYWFKRPPDEVARKVLELALADAKKYYQLVPTDPRGALQISRIFGNMAYVNGDAALTRTAIGILDALLSSENLTKYGQADALSSRGLNYNVLGKTDQALTDLNKAIELIPTEPVFWEHRAIYWDANRRPDLAATDRAKGKELRANLTEKGIKITELAEDGAAKKADLRVGDILVNMGGSRIQSHEQLVAALTKAKGAVEVVVIRGGKRETLSVTPVNAKIGITFDVVELK